MLKRVELLWVDSRYDDGVFNPLIGTQGVLSQSMFIFRYQPDDLEAVTLNGAAIKELTVRENRKRAVHVHLKHLGKTWVFRKIE